MAASLAAALAGGLVAPLLEPLLPRRRRASARRGGVATVRLLVLPMTLLRLEAWSEQAFAVSAAAAGAVAAGAGADYERAAASAGAGEEGVCAEGSDSSDCRPSLSGSDTLAACLARRAALPQRSDFFRRVQAPPGMERGKFGEFLARGGIHPRGVVLTSEFYELPLRVNATRLEEEVDRLLLNEDWEGADPRNSQQGVVSTHFRFTKSQGKDLEGPYKEVGDRLARSPYVRSILAELGGVVGNVALMRLDAGKTVEAHFDTNEYWDARVRVHIPVKTSGKVSFSCGQRGEMQRLKMKRGGIYLFDNHLAHEVVNKGKSPRVHLTVDMVGSRRFWSLVHASRRIGSDPRKATVKPRPVGDDEDARVAVESWRDLDLQGENACSAAVRAMAETAASLNLEAEARELAEAWCAELRSGSSSSRGRSRREEIDRLQQLAAEADCSRAPGGRGPGLSDVADALSGAHRLAEADLELRVIGGEVEQ